MKIKKIPLAIEEGNDLVIGKIMSGKKQGKFRASISYPRIEIECIGNTVKKAIKKLEKALTFTNM